LATLTSDTCECGMTCMRIKNGIEGRRDDMIWYKGTNIFPSAIEEVVRREECLSDEFLILLERKGERQTLTVQVQARLGLEKDKWDGVRQLLQQELHSAIKVKADVVVLPPGTLVTTQYKAKRVLDLRN